MESEWDPHPGAIKYDFEKLLLANSPLKLMIFQSDPLRLDQVYQLIENGISAFMSHPSQATYILAGLDIRTEDFNIRIINA